MVLKELTRNTTPTSERIAAWVAHHKLTVLTTKVGDYYNKAMAEALPIKNWIASAVEVERRAVTAGRQFSQIRFPP